MSLDVYLYKIGERKPCSECGKLKDEPENEELFWANITHNLTRMAEEAGIYKHLWRPEEIGVTHAKDLIEPLKSSLEKMKADPEHFKKFDAPNGWGRYIHFVPWVEQYLNACVEYPDALVRVSR